ncbi:MAG: hypothetical protein IJ062_01775 [Firmicutes bacterium]|nr:hypothetical protein [Bacillota bacterium]
MENENNDIKIKLDDTKIINMCPCCGKGITEASDAGNGFCLACTRAGLLN